MVGHFRAPRGLSLDGLAPFESAVYVGNLRNPRDPAGVSEHRRLAFNLGWEHNEKHL
jgi:hypothetical protein